MQTITASEFLALPQTALKSAYSTHEDDDAWVAIYGAKGGPKGADPRKADISVYDRSRAMYLTVLVWGEIRVAWSDDSGRHEAQIVCG